ncbi:hypothetical protein ACQPW3_06650 [Actinosynnema sp. CA-248983]
MIKTRLVRFIRSLAVLLALTATTLTANPVVDAPKAEAWPTIVYSTGEGLMSAGGGVMKAH